MSLDLWADLSLSFIFMVGDSAQGTMPAPPQPADVVDDYMLACMGCYMP